MQTKEFLTVLDEKAVAEAITQAELRTSGEIRVFVCAKAVEDPVQEAGKQFEALGMTKTRERNGVLIYFAPKAQCYAVVGDSAVHQRCGEGFWRHITDDMNPLLKSGKVTEAVVLAIREIGEVLAREFPRRPDDIDELPNTIVRGGG